MYVNICPFCSVYVYSAICETYLVECKWYSIDLLSIGVWKGVDVYLVYVHSDIGDSY